MDKCLRFVIWFVLLTWGISSFAHCGLEAWPVMEDIELISLGSEIWPREFETVTPLLMIRAVPCSLPTPWLCFDLHPSIVSFAQYHPWDHYMTFPSSAFLAFHIPSLIRPGRVWGVWAQGCSCMTRDSLWSLDGLRYVDWLFAWWDCRLFVVSIEIDLVWWELACDGQSCLMRSPFTLPWDDHLWDYHRAFELRFDAWFERVDVVISDGHRSLVLIIWGLDSTMLETVVAGWVAFISVSSYPITFIDI